MAVRPRSTRLLRLAALASAVPLVVTGLTASGAGAAPRGSAGGLRLSDAQPTLTDQQSLDKAPSSRLARTPKRLLRLTSAKQVPVMIKYDYDAAASYTGTVQGLAATSPSVTARPLRKADAHTRTYLRYAKRTDRSITRAVRAAVPDARIGSHFRVVYGGVSATLPGNQIRKVLRVPGVVAVQRNSLRQPLTDSSAEFINATAAYDELGTTANAGEGVIYGNIDSGVWPEHPSFADQGNLAAPAETLTCDFGDNPLTPASDPFECNNKLIGGYSFLDDYDLIAGTDYPYVDTARDGEGHGSHTASTSAGNVVDDVDLLGITLPRIHGIAPGAQVVEYRVCATLGCFGSDSARAVQQAILDGVKVINFSISGGTQPLTDPVELAFLDAYNAGVFVAASAGNDGPGAGTANHLSPWVTTVAASTQRREFASTLTLTAGNGDTFTVDGASITAGAGPAPLTLASAAPYSDALCTTPAPAGTFTGQIVACERGGNARVDKGFNVAQGGAAGMVLYNPVLADVETDNHWLPAVHVADGTEMVAFVGSHSDITARFTAGAPRDGQGDVMAAFSSRGPAGNFVKPDITAPGVQIVGANTPTPEGTSTGPSGEYYQAIAGTSMSSPHIAGAAILVASVHPDWTPGQIKSALMTQALTSVVKEDTTTPADPFDMGAGRVDVGAALEAPLTISDTAERFAALTDNTLRAVDLNIPSINAPTMPGRLVTRRTLQNVTGHTLQVTSAVTAGAGTTITTRPSRFSIPAGGHRTVQVVIRSSAPVGTQQFAQLRFRTDHGTAHLPVAFVPQQSGVDVAQSCDHDSVAVGESAVCTVSATNESFDSQDVTMTTSKTRRLRLASADGATLRNHKAHASASLAGAQLGVPSVDPGTTPGGGFLDLADFGATPNPVGDEDLLSLDVPSFVYNGQVYDEVSIDSNGYAIAGPAGSADNECCTLPTGPSAVPPNNLMAPLWTDLNGEGAPGVSFAALSDGTSNWVVVQWDVNVFGTTDTRHFQVWIGVNGTQDVSYAYSGAQADPNGQPFLVGAENQQGEGDMEAVLPTSDLVVTSTDPVPGDTLTYSVTVVGKRHGSAGITTETAASGVRGITVTRTALPVTR